MRLRDLQHGADRDLAAELSRWVALGLVSADQSAAIREHERRRAIGEVKSTAVASPRKVAPVAEALGYLGGILATVGLVLLVARYWPDMATPGRLALSAGSTVALLIAGTLVPEHADPAFARLRGFLWLASAATGALFAFVACQDGLGITKRATVVFACAAFVTLQSGVLWWGRNRPLQQLSFLGADVVAAGAATAIAAGEGPVGLVVWSVGAAYLIGGLRRLATFPLLTELVGAIALTVGAITTASSWQAFGLPFAAMNALALLALAVAPQLGLRVNDRRLCAVVGALTLLAVGPGAIGYFAREAGLVTGATVWGFGSVLLFLGANRRVRVPAVVEVAGGVALIAGAAITAVQLPGFAPIFGIATAVGLVVLGMLPGRVLLSVFGSVGLLVNVPWAIGWFFPGDGRAPLLILISGVLILVLAVFLSRQRGRFRSELASRH
ncbi:MAG: DUF2157 domain-containing protein [Actinobacteria bacterium]|nr:DUF2157 domain-containing protein [Actinomycetota bacterium]